MKDDGHCLHPGKRLMSGLRIPKDSRYCCYHNVPEVQPRTPGILSEKVPAGWLLVAAACSTVGGVIITRLWVAFL